MRDLQQIQRWMQTVVMSLGGATEGVASREARQILDVAANDVEQVVTRSRALTGLERLDIYNRAYYARLLECLRGEFPVLVHAVGEDAFDQFALDYLQKYPSHSYTLNQLGVNFPRYLAESRPAEESPEASAVSLPDFLIDLATLEQTYSEVFDGPGVERERLLDLEQLAAIPAERWPEAQLVPVCCLRLIALRYPIHRYHAAVRKQQEPTFPRPRTTFLAITRRQYVVRRYPLTRLQRVLLAALLANQPIGEAIVQTAAAAGPRARELSDKLRLWFRNWTAEGFFHSVRLPSG